MKIINSDPEDIDAIFKLYDEAIKYQKIHFTQHWQGFDKEMVEKETAEKKQWKVLDADENICCIFATAYTDPFIWEDKDKDPSIYLHRIVTNPLCRGKNYMLNIVEWAKCFGKENQKKFIRLDTWGENKKLIDYYIKCGFKFIGLIKLEEASDLPKHYSTALLGLLEIEITNS
ncbi:MAG: GNAT family N-acetyltransferase [Ferruginibacter sp.]